MRRDHGRELRLALVTQTVTDSNKVLRELQHLRFAESFAGRGHCAGARAVASSAAVRPPGSGRPGESQGAAGGSTVTCDGCNAAVNFLVGGLGARTLDRGTRYARDSDEVLGCRESAADSRQYRRKKAAVSQGFLDSGPSTVEGPGGFAGTLLGTLPRVGDPLGLLLRSPTIERSELRGESAMTHLRHASGFVAASLVFTIALAEARANQTYAAMLPNGAKLGCENGVCHKATTAETDLTQFGKNVNTALTDPAGVWATLCQKDVDGDGKTNGQELGDPCCAWIPGAEPASTDVSNPNSIVEATGLDCTGSGGDSGDPLPAAGGAPTTGGTTAGGTAASGGALATGGSAAKSSGGAKSGGTGGKGGISGPKVDEAGAGNFVLDNPADLDCGMGHGQRPVRFIPLSLLAAFVALRRRTSAARQRSRPGFIPPPT